MTGAAGAANTVGIIVNPAAGKDIRRLVSAASPTSDMAKVGIVRRAVIGAIEGGAQRILLSDDRRSLSARAIERLDTDCRLDLLPTPPWDVGRNSTVAAMLMRDEAVGAVIVLGGDGTHRDVVKGWRHAPMVALSTGTNNVFPRHFEATVAGHAAAAVATGLASLDTVSWQAKVLDVEVCATDGAEAEADLALVDLAHVDSSFTASRAVWEAGRLRELVATIAEPASVGLSAIAARLAPVSRREPGAVHVTCGGPNAQSHRVPIAPGLYGDIAVSGHRRLANGETVTMCGPGVLSFDGERDVVLVEGRQARVTVADDGPHIIDITAAMAATAQSSQSPPGDHDHNG